LHREKLEKTHDNRIFLHYPHHTTHKTEVIMNIKLSKFAIAATLGLAITFTLNACEEKEAAKAPAPVSAEEAKAKAEAEAAAAAAAAKAKAEVEAAEAEKAKTESEDYVKANGGTFTDSRDKKTYKTTKIGEQVWMAENLAYQAKNSKCYEDKQANCEKYGRLYNWKTALGVCPQGWHLPSDNEWQTLVDFAGGDEVAGKKLKAIRGWSKSKSGNDGTDNYGFAALPGSAVSSSGGFGGLYAYAYYWSATELNAISAYLRWMYYDYEKVVRDHYHKVTYLHSVRCVQTEADAAALAKVEAMKAAEKTMKAATKKAGCGKGSGGVKLPECIITGSGEVRKFEYDEQNRIVKIGDETITYADNLVTVGTQKFVINGNTVMVDGDTLIIDKNGYIAKYEYKDGNMIKVSWNESGAASYYSYDKKKSPFSNSNTPKWLIQRLVREYSASKNNILEINTEGEISSSVTYSYQYDSEGFPTNETNETYVEGNEETEIKSYTYYGGK